MANRKSKKAQRIAAKDKKQSRQFFVTVIGITIVLLIIMYLTYSNL